MLLLGASLSHLMSTKSPWKSRPANAWCKYIASSIGKPKWIEDGAPISESIPLKKRELFAQIVIAHAINNGNDKWRVGYDPADGQQQNDGNVSNGKRKLIIEHKLVTQMEKGEVLTAILDRYEKAKILGEQYGKNRVLVIQPNKKSDHGGLIKISSLRDLIGKESPFEQVLSLGATAFIQEGKAVAMHLIQHYPENKKGDSGITQVDLDFFTGEAQVSSSGINWYI